MTRVGTGFWYLTEVSVKILRYFWALLNARIVKWIPTREVLPPDVHRVDKPVPGHALHGREKDEGKNSKR